MVNWSVCVALMLTAVVMLSVVAYAQQPMRSLLLAYGNVSALGAEGGNVTGLVNELNEAITLYVAGHYANASALASGIIASAPGLAKAIELRHIELYSTYAAVGAIALIIVSLAYLKRRELIGGLWLRFRGEGMVTVGGGKPRGFITDEEVLAVATAIALILVVFVTAQALVSGEAASFSAIGLLGPSGKIGGYPSVASVNQSINLYLLVYNHMNRPVWYVVYVYVTNTTASPPIGGEPALVYQRVLLSNETWITPLSLSLNETGRFRIVGELWMYSPVNLTLTYTGEYVQLWVNVTNYG